MNKVGYALCKSVDDYLRLCTEKLEPYVYAKEAKEQNRRDYAANQWDRSLSDIEYVSSKKDEMLRNLQSGRIADEYRALQNNYHSILTTPLYISLQLQPLTSQITQVKEEVNRLIIEIENKNRRLKGVRSLQSRAHKRLVKEVATLDTQIQKKKAQIDRLQENYNQQKIELEKTSIDKAAFIKSSKKMIASNLAYLCYSLQPQEKSFLLQLIYTLYYAFIRLFAKRKIERSLETLIKNPQALQQWLCSKIDNCDLLMESEQALLKNLFQHDDLVIFYLLANFTNSLTQIKDNPHYLGKTRGDLKETNDKTQALFQGTLTRSGIYDRLYTLFDQERSLTTRDRGPFSQLSGSSTTSFYMRKWRLQPPLFIQKLQPNLHTWVAL